jgi:16S rRNA (guanine527-N7)-methyltransferase
MHPARIAELLVPFLGTPPANDMLCHNISTYIDILLRWNAGINLTAIRNPEEIVTRHFGESLFAARHLFPDVSAAPFKEQAPPPIESRQESVAGAANDPPPRSYDRPSLADVGSGAGFPGIPLRLWNPRIDLTLIESNHKKTLFLREIARSLTLTDINVFNGRAQDLRHAQARFDIVTLRAVEHFEQVIRVSAELLTSRGRLALLIGSSQEHAATTILPFLSWSTPRPIPLSRSRSFLVGTSPI